MYVYNYYSLGVFYFYCGEEKLNSKYKSKTCIGYESETITNRSRRVTSFIKLEVRKECSFNMLSWFFSINLFQKISDIHRVEDDPQCKTSICYVNSSKMCAKVSTVINY